MGKRARVILNAILITLVMTSTSVQARNAAALDWLKTSVEDNVALDIRVDKHKLAFRGGRQTRYAVSFSRQLNQDWQFEAIAHYHRGALHFGTLSQTVKTQSYELVAWREFEDMRVGVTHTAQPRHQISLPVGDEVNLPTSETVGVYVDMDVDSTVDQVVRVALLQETWTSTSTTLPVGWLQSQDSQLHLRYSLTF